MLKDSNEKKIKLLKEQIALVSYLYECCDINISLPINALSP